MRNAAQLRADLANSIPSVHVYHNATQDVATNNALAFNSERWDRWGMHDPSTNNSRITIKVPGVYSVGGAIQAGSDAAGYTFFTCRVVINGTIEAGVPSLPPLSAGVTALSNVSVQVRLTKGDYVELFVSYVRGSGGNATFAASDTGNNQRQCEFWATWIAGY